MGQETSSKKGIHVALAFFILVFGTGLASAQETKTLLIGDVNPLTGPGADWGVGSMRALDLNAERINKAGGIVVQGERYNIKFTHEDDKYTGAGGVAAVNKLIFTDKVKFIVGPLSAASIMAFQPITEANKVLMVCDSYAPPELLRGKKYTFRAFNPPTHLAPAFFDWMRKTYPNLKRVVHITPNDATGWGAAQGDNDAADRAGFEIVSNEFYERGTQDFTAMLTRVLAKKPDLFAMGGTTPGDTALIIKQAREFGYKGMIQHSGMLDPDAIGPIAGWDNVEGILSIAIGWPPGPLMPEPMREFLRDYKARHNDVNTFAPHVYDQLTVLVLGIKRANSLDPDKVAHAIENDLGKFDTLFGKAYMGGLKLYGRNAQIIRNGLFSQIKNRKLEVVGSAMAWEEPPTEKKWRP